MAATLILLASVLSAVAAGPISERIAGGEVTSIPTYPFSVIISYNRLGFGVFQFTCGGSIVSSRAILTAAFCVHGDQPFRYRVRVGSAVVNGGTIHTVDYFAIHPDYNSVTKENDIALIHVFPHLLMSTSVQMGRFADINYSYRANQTVYAIGFGQINYGGALSDSLRRVQLYLLDHMECRFRYNRVAGPNVTNNMICAIGFDPSGKGQCLGDNGSPLLDDRLIIGLYSWSHQCATFRYPGVNTYIPAYANWIKSQY